MHRFIEWDMRHSANGRGEALFVQQFNQFVEECCNKVGYPRNYATDSVDVFAYIRTLQAQIDFAGLYVFKVSFKPMYSRWGGVPQDAKKVYRIEAQLHLYMADLSNVNPSDDIHSTA